VLPFSLPVHVGQVNEWRGWWMGAKNSVDMLSQEKLNGPAKKARRIRKRQNTNNLMQEVVGWDNLFG
jgi:hypothetical protein